MKIPQKRLSYGLSLCEKNEFDGLDRSSILHPRDSVTNGGIPQFDNNSYAVTNVNTNTSTKCQTIPRSGYCSNLSDTEALIRMKVKLGLKSETPNRDMFNTF